MFLYELFYCWCIDQCFAYGYCTSMLLIAIILCVVSVKFKFNKLDYVSVCNVTFKAHNYVTFSVIKLGVYLNFKSDQITNGILFLYSLPLQHYFHQSLTDRTQNLLYSPKQNQSRLIQQQQTLHVYQAVFVPVMFFINFNPLPAQLLLPFICCTGTRLNQL